MTVNGTDAYAGRTGLPPRVAKAVELARRQGFATSCRPEQGELLRVLPRGVGPGRIGETGTGCGVGLAWLASAAHEHARIVSIERDADRAAAAALLFRDDPRVRAGQGDWPDLQTEAPLDLLVLDGGGQGKGDEPPLDPSTWVRAGGLIVIDDFTPTTQWPPMYDGKPDVARRYWLDHPRLRSALITIAPDAATIVATAIA